MCMCVEGAGCGWPFGLWCEDNLVVERACVRAEEARARSCACMCGLESRERDTTKHSET